MDGTVRQGGERRRFPHTAASVSVTLLGVALLAYMIVVEDEPGALPLALIAAGVAWFLVARLRVRARRV
jgi:hypothetical protein